MLLLATYFARLNSALCCALLVTGSPAAPTIAAADSDAVRVSTYAGSGELGMADGDANAATFMLPAGLAAGRDGTVFVADEDAQRIRAIAHGKVTTVAGSGDADTLGFSVPGGYVDGPALSAKFNAPLGVAVGPDGALYVADSRNAAIREVKNGVVSTLVGRPGSTTSVDGDAATARLVRPRALAFDANGKLWIADFGGGLRCWDRGTLTTVPLGANATDVLSVAVTPDDGEVLAVTTSAILRFAPRTGALVPVSSGDRLGATVTAEGDNEFGTPSSIAGIGHGQAIFSDVLANNIRYVRFAIPPFIIWPYTRAIAGGAFERKTDNAGFADGDANDARFAAPRGLIVVGSSAIVADSANRRIRIFSLPSFRLPETGKNSEYTYDRQHFEVALVGASIVFFDSHDGDSMCASIERQLDASGRFGTPARCHTVRIDATRIDAAEDYVEANLAFRPVGCVVLSMSPGFVFDLDPKNHANALALFRESIVALLRELEPSKAKLAIYWQYPDTAISNREQLGTAEIDARYGSVTPDALDRIARAEQLRAIRSLDGLGVTVCDSFDAAVAYEKGTGPPLFSPDNGHYVDRGNAFFGTVLGDCLAGNLPSK